MLTLDPPPHDDWSFACYSNTGFHKARVVFFVPGKWHEAAEADTLDEAYALAHAQAVLTSRSDRAN